jgi:cytochrome o ubiquinol oxidase subunit 1
MFGNLSLSAIPFGVPIVMDTISVVIVLGLALLAVLTWYRKWGVLWSGWFTSVDHKRIGVMYIVLTLVMLLRGLADAIMMRTQLAVASGGSAGYLPPQHYDQIFTAHGVIMIFFMAMPFLVGLMNIVVPLQIGARDVAFPFLNSLSFWLTVAGAVLVNLSLGVGEFARTGWLAYPPLSELAFSPGVGVDYYIWALQLSGLGTLLTGVNFFVTILKMRAPGMSLMKMPIFTWTALCTNALIIFAFPILTVTLALLSADRYLGMHFFTSELGGNPMMYVNMIWAWGHPEVYILVLPAFGVYSEVAATFASKRLFGYASMVWATVAIMLLSFLVWMHHFFTMGSGADVNAFFGITTMIIAVPTGVKVFSWLFTIYRGRLRFTTPVLWTLGFMVTFVIGGMTGVLMAVPANDFVLHNSLFLVAHFHNVLIGGALFGFFAGFNYWFPKAFGFTLDERLGKLAFGCWLVGFYVAFMPLYLLGLMGMTRRMNHYDNPAWTPYLVAAAVGVFIIALGVLLQLTQLVVSFRQRAARLDRTGDPWGGRTLEWATASPPPVYNFAAIPVVGSIDALADMKARGVVPTQPGGAYADITMPRNTAAGLVMGALGLVLGFALVWHIWWLAAAGLAGMIATFIRRTFDADTEYVIGAEEVARTEALRFQLLAKGA